MSKATSKEVPSGASAKNVETAHSMAEDVLRSSLSSSTKSNSERGQRSGQTTIQASRGDGADRAPRDRGESEGAPKKLIILLIVLAVLSFFRNEIFQALNSVANQTDVSSSIGASPHFKVTTYGKVNTRRSCWSASGQDEPGSCGGNPYTTTTTNYLKVQSANQPTLTVTDVVVNGKKDCLAGLTLPRKLDYGDTTTGVLLCDPLEVTIVTDHGESTYTFRN